MADISITYDKQHYAPGDSVTARIEVRVKHSPLKLFSIECSVIGRATVQWQEYEPGGMAGNYKNYSSSHTYISLSEILLTPPKNDESISLSVGLHTFEYKLVDAITHQHRFYDGIH
ncbi:hypothetical protein PENTCL1PPCAC_8819 [Pristionchus entomophagus]|uniref:Arrestin-like N-terminal domain-containing protein n=1 Tax=Pristionchus entomophagus TaxID=358040 RepID=A0AAV5SUU5_9BILA|nr:hypothetical protein PENTCL1PPCAC_8819 [Pristionchus entomophagus]